MDWEYNIYIEDNVNIYGKWTYDTNGIEPDENLKTKGHDDLY